MERPVSHALSHLAPQTYVRRIEMPPGVEFWFVRNAMPVRLRVLNERLEYEVGQPSVTWAVGEVAPSREFEVAL